MDKVINIDEYKNNRFKKTDMILTAIDFFNLFLVFARNEDNLPLIDLNVLMRSFAKYRSVPRYASLYQNIEVEQNEDGEEIVNIRGFLKEKINNKTIVQNPSRENEFMILGTDDEFDELKGKYDGQTLSIFGDLMFNIIMDLIHGIDNWSLVAEDEYIEDPIYPGIVTGEFVGQEKDKRVMKKVRKRLIERLKNLYK